MTDSTNLIVCLTTVASMQDADRIALLLLDHSLAACVQIAGPIRSHYIWQGQRHCDEEYRLVIKTTAKSWPKLKAELLEIHPYDEPQVLSLSVDDATEGYRDWVVAQTDDTI